MANIYAKTQEVGMKMMELKEKKMNFMEIWNNVQVYSGQIVAMQTGDLYILEHCLKRLEEIKHS